MKKFNIGWITVGISLMAGCGDPETSRLPVGRKVIGISHDRKYDTLWLSKSSNGLMPGLTQGTHMTVVDDQDKPEDGQGIRDVKVHVEDGEFKGVSGVLTRWDLRPE